MHIFTINNEYFMYNYKNGSLCVLDLPSFNYLKYVQSGDSSFIQNLSQQEIKQIQDELDSLDQSHIDVDAQYVDDGSVKALCLHICHDCNLRCAYCFASQGTFKGQTMHMSFEVGAAAVDFLIANSGKIKNLEIDFFGGEPLMNFEAVKKITEYAKQQCQKNNKNILFTMTTNCLLLDSQADDFLYQEMSNVVLSIDGRESVHNSARPTPNGKGSYDIAVKNAKRFLSKRQKSYYVRGTFTSKNLDFSNDVFHLSDLGFEHISVEPVVLPDWHELAIKEGDVDRLCDEYEKLAVEYVKRRSNGNKISFFHFFVDLENSPCLQKCLKGCGAGGNYLAVTPEGSIYPCHQFADKPEFKMGNVFDGQVDGNIRKMFADVSVLKKDECADCFAKFFCSGGCNANAYNFNGDLYKPHKISCLLMKKRLECALYVYAKEKMSF